MYRFVAFGHSHIVAFAKGAYEYDATLPGGAPRALGEFVYLYDPSYHPVLQQRPAHAAELNPKLLEQLRRPEWQFVVLVCGGNEHNVLGIVRNKRPFDFVLSSAPDLQLQPGYELVPEALVREVLRSFMEEPLQAMRAFRASTALPIIQLEPPPPLPNRRVLAYPSEFVRARLFRKNIAPELIRHKLWRLETDIYRRFCEEIGIAYLPAPASMVAADGTLAETAWGADATHANSRYGIEVLKDVIALHGLHSAEAQVSS